MLDEAAVLALTASMSPALGFHDEIRRHTPPAFERRGVFIDARELASV